MIKFKKIVLFISFFLFALSLYSQTESDKKLAVSKIVIFNIKAININKSVADAVTQNLTFELNNFAKYGNFEAIEKSRFINLFKSVNLNIDDPVELDNALKLSRMINAEFGLFGSISKLGSNYTLNIRVVRTLDGIIVLDKTEYFNSEDVLPDIIEKVAKAVNGLKSDIEKNKKVIEKLEKVLFLFPVHNIEADYARNFYDQMNVTIATYKKFYSADQTVVINLYDKLNKKIFDEVLLEDIIEMGKQAEAKYVLYTKINRENNVNIITVTLYKTEDGSIDYNRVFLTRYDESLTLLAKKVVENITLEKDKRIASDVTDFDKGELEAQIKNHEKARNVLYAVGFSLVGVGGASLVTAITLTGIYGYRLYQTSVNTAYFESVEYAKTNSYLLTSFVILYSLGGITAIIGGCLNIVAYFTFNEKVRDFENAKKRLGYLSPVIELYPDRIALGATFKF